VISNSSAVEKCSLPVSGKEIKTYKWGGMGVLEAVLRIRDPVLFYPLDPGSRSGMNFFRIPDLGSKGYVFGEIFLRILGL
jgi:hypothetical protein